MALAGYKAAVFVGGAPLAFTNEAMTVGADNKTYTIVSAEKSTWDLSFPPTIEKAAPPVEGQPPDWQPATGYSVNYLLGQVVFDQEQPTGTSVRASGKYLPLTQVADATEWDLSLDVDTKDATRFRSEYKQMVPMLKGGTVKFSRWWVDAYFTNTVVTSPLLLALYTDDSHGYKAYGYIKSDSVQDAVDDLAQEEINLDINGALEPF